MNAIPGNSNNSEGRLFKVSDLNRMLGLDLNYSLITLPALMCQNCKNILYPPVMLLESVGNVCGFCKIIDGVDVTLNGVRNVGLEAILRPLAIPCRYHERGCAEMLDFDVHDHLEVCAYRKFYCPLKLVDVCEWEGDLGSMLNHCLIYHLHSTMRAFRSSFFLNLDTSPASNVLKVLYTDIDKFILRFKCDGEKLLFIMYFIGHKERLSNLSYIVEHRELGTISNEYGSTILHEESIKSSFDEDQALTIDLTVVKEFIVDSSINLTIKILKKNQSSHQLDEKLLSYFECPVCTSYMKPPIYQCSAGHSICNRCKPKLQHCHICRGDLDNMQNHTLENISNNMEFPCVFRDNGCAAILPAKNIVKHEAECSLQPYQCLFENCHWQGVYSAMSKHLQNSHSQTLVFGSLKALFGKLNCNIEFCMIAYGQIFRVLCLFDVPYNNIHCTVQLVGPEEYAKRFKYEFALIGDMNRSYIRTDVCQNYTTCRDEIFAQSSVIPYSAVLHYAENEEILHYCRIIKLSP